MRSEFDRAWPALGTKPIRQDGQNRVVVPAAADQQYYRLAKP